MATILGLRGTDDLTSDERPLDWETAHLIMYPNGQAPLVALLSQVTSQVVTGDPQFQWWERHMTPRRVQMSGTATTGDTTFDLTYYGNGTDAAPEIQVGQILRNERTGEQVRCSANTGASPITVVRAVGDTAAAAVNDDDVFLILGTAFEEGSTAPDGMSGAPTKKYNYTQIFKGAYQEARSAFQQTARWAPEGTITERRREALERFSISKEQQYRWGERDESTGAGGLPLRSTAGIRAHIQAAVSAGVAVAAQVQESVGTMTEEEFDEFLETLFHYGSDERFVLCNNRFLTFIQRIAKSKLYLVDKKDTYGMNVRMYEHSQGMLYLKTDPLFNYERSTSGRAWFIDFAEAQAGLRMKERYLMRTQLKTNAQANDADSRKDYYICETGLQVPFAERFGILDGITAFQVAA